MREQNQSSRGGNVQAQGKGTPANLGQPKSASRYTRSNYVLNALAIRSLETIRQTCHVASNEFGPLKCTLFEAGPRTKEKVRSEAPRGLFPEDRIIWKGWSPYPGNSSLTPEERTIRLYWYTSVDEDRGREALRKFTGLARDVDRVFPYLIPALRIPDDTVYPRGPRWMYTLFDLAWQLREGSALAAGKSLWISDGTFPWNPGNQNQTMQSALYRLGGWPLDEPADAFCSRLPDVLAASVQAIDIALYETSMLAEPTRTPDGDEARSISKRLKIRRSDDGCDHTVILDGATFRVKGDQAIEFLQTLLTHAGNGKRAKASVLKAICGQRADVLYKKLPKAIQDTIDKPGRGGIGYGLKDPGLAQR